MYNRDPVGKFFVQACTTVRTCTRTITRTCHGHVDTRGRASKRNQPGPELFANTP
jgi:hypothetical protein